MFSQAVVNHVLAEEAEFDLAIDRAIADYLSSSEEEDNKEWGGSRKGKAMYFLVDGIYPEWAIFVTTFTTTNEKKKKKFAGVQEAVRKDIECAFGIVVAKFHVLQRPLRGWYLEDLRDLVHCCVIIHNMVVLQKRGTVGNEEADDITLGNSLALFGRNQVTNAEAIADGVDVFGARVAAFEIGMESSYEHFILKRDLVEYVNAVFD